MVRWMLPVILLALAAGVVAADVDEGETPENPLPARYAKKFSLNEPMYFSMGWRGDTNARFQISFRYRFVGTDTDTGLADALIGHTYFGFTQVSFWDVGARSSPFRDTNYRPSLFYFKSDIRRNWMGARRVGLQAGFEHESNGRDGDSSRSVNILFVRPVMTFGDPEGYVLTVAPKIWLYVGDLSDNPDIEDYRGYFQLLVRYEKAGSWGFTTYLRKGTRKNYGSLEFNASYPLDRLFRKRFDSYLHLQYFNGWGESLLDYNVKSDAQFRLGLMVVR